MAQFEFAIVDPSAPLARSLLHEYYGDVLTRRLGRPVADDEVTAAFSSDPNDGMTPPGGLFIVASSNGLAVGCAGLRTVAVQTGEVKRVYVRPAGRRTGLGTQLMDRLEEHASALGLTTLRLDTRHDLYEARAMYAARGYRETPRFNDSGLAEVWLAKRLPPRTG